MDYPMTFARFKEGLERGELLGLQCKGCGGLVFPPSMVCPRCTRHDLEIKPLLSSGVIRTFTVIRVAPAGFSPPYIVALVELDDGPWVMGNLEEVGPDQATLALMGRKVRVGSRNIPADPYSGGEGVTLTFRLEGSGDAA